MKRILALLLMLVIIVGSVFFGTWRSLTKLRGEVDDSFFTPEDSYGFVTPSIQDDLTYVLGESYNLLVIAKNYCGVNDANMMTLMLTRDNLSSAVAVDEKFTAMTALSEAVTALYRQIADDSSVTQQHLDLAKTYYGDITSTLSVISDNYYNEKAADYNKRLDGFPAMFIAPLLGIEKAPLFK